MKKAVLIVIIFLLVTVPVVGFFLTRGVEVQNAQVVNLGANSVTVVWETDSDSYGRVFYSEDSEANWRVAALSSSLADEVQIQHDERDMEYDEEKEDYFVQTDLKRQRRTHFVTLRDLMPETKYYFRVDNGAVLGGGETMEFMTSPQSKSISPPDAAYGKLLTDSPDETIGDGVLLYSIASVSQPTVSLTNTKATLINSDANYSLDLANFIDPATGNQFRVNSEGNVLRVQVISENLRADQSVSLEETRPLADINLINVSPLEVADGELDTSVSLPGNNCCADDSCSNYSGDWTAGYQACVNGECAKCQGGGAICGNGTCESDKGENSSTCSTDCGAADSGSDSGGSSSDGGDDGANSGTTSGESNSVKPEVVAGAGNKFCPAGQNSCVDSAGIARCEKPYQEACGQNLKRQITCGPNGEFNVGACNIGSGNASAEPTCPGATIYNASTGECDGTGDEGTKSYVAGVEATVGGSETTIVDTNPNTGKGDLTTRANANSRVASGGSSGATGGSGGAALVSRNAVSSSQLQDVVDTCASVINLDPVVINSSIANQQKLTDCYSKCDAIGYSQVECKSNLTNVSSIIQTVEEYQRCLSDSSRDVADICSDVQLEICLNNFNVDGICNRQEIDVDSSTLQTAEADFENTCIGTIPSIGDKFSQPSCQGLIEDICEETGVSEGTCPLGDTLEAQQMIDKLDKYVDLGCESIEASNACTSAELVLCNEYGVGCDINQDEVTRWNCPAETRNDGREFVRIGEVSVATPSQKCTYVPKDSGVSKVHYWIVNEDGGMNAVVVNINEEDEPITEEARRALEEAEGPADISESDAQSVLNNYCKNGGVNNDFRGTITSCIVGDSNTVVEFIKPGGESCIATINFRNGLRAENCAALSEDRNMDEQDSQLPLSSTTTSTGNLCSTKDVANDCISIEFDGYDFSCRSQGLMRYCCNSSIAGLDEQRNGCPVSDESSDDDQARDNFLNNLVSDINAQPIPQSFEEGEPGLYSINLFGEDVAVVSILQEGQSIELFLDSNSDGIKQDNEPVVNPNGPNIQISKIEEITSYSFNPGWNLIALDFFSDELDQASELITELDAQGVEAVQVSSYVNGDWRHFVQRLDKQGDQVQFGRDFQLIPGRSYFVRSLNTGDAVLRGNPYDSSVPFSIDQGWNLISVISSQDYTATQVLNLCKPETQCTEISRYQNGQYNSVIENNGQFFGNDFEISSSKGYFVFNESGNKTVTP